MNCVNVSPQGLVTPESRSLIRLYDVHPCEKAIGIFFQNRVWYLLKDQLRMFKNAKYLSAVISRGRVMKH